MQTEALTITTPAGTYPILVGPDLHGQLPALLADLELRGALWLISDSAAYPHYGPAIEASLRAAGHTLHSYQVPSGEASKDLAMVSKLYDWMIGGGVERRDAVLALGGGVIGDLAGFVAATVLRGIAFIQLPTTLLAMVDSALGGKTGVNHPLGKNLIGAFHQPRLVLSDIATLATLPPRELRAGWAEVIKHGVIRDPELFDQLEELGPQLGHQPESVGRYLASQAQQTGAIIRRAAKVKVDVVNADERETGERMLLNYGHTLGHALEASAGYGVLLHGEAVSIGMMLAAHIAEGLGMFDAALFERQERLLQVYGLPVRIPEGIDRPQLVERTLRDKKVRAGRVRWVLPTAIGNAVIRNDIPEELVQQVVAQG